jgi:hypothetical protein
MRYLLQIGAQYTGSKASNWSAVTELISHYTIDYRTKAIVRSLDHSSPLLW